jgi:basic membrane lipoprotein Med (substrate-binding protein (PBP1-ABC) superfamily)
MRRRRVVLGATLLALIGAAAVLTANISAGPSAAYKVAWIYVGPHNDHGWSEAHDKGRLAVQKAFGSKVKTTYKELVPEGPQACQVIEGLIRDGYKMIFSTSFGFQPCTVSEAKKHPDVLFEMATGTAQRKNLAEYFGAGEDTIYLAGMAAGAATKKGVIGYIGSFPIAEVIRHTNAFALGAQRTHPGVKVKLVWTHDWVSVEKARKAAESLVAAGADVLGQNIDPPTAGQYAEQKGIAWTGYDADARKFAPKAWLTAAIYNWGVYYVPRVRAAMNGTWKTGFYYGSIKDGFTSLAPYGPRVKKATKVAIAKVKAQLVSRTFYEFTGPLYDQKGKLRVPKGKRLMVKDLYAMNWLVRGVIGNPKG